MPSVVGALIAGIVLGPAFLNIVGPSDLINSLSEIGVIVLMFAAGLETSVSDLKKGWIKSFYYCGIRSIGSIRNGICCSIIL